MFRRRTILGMVAAVGAARFSPMNSLAKQSTPASDEDVESGYAPIGDLQMYFESHGEGAPLILIHGAFESSQLWSPIVPELATNRRVVAIDLQGHGRTADIDRPFGYEDFADDVASLMDHLGIEKADIVGYSIGGNTAIQVAIRHPERVSKLVTISANFRSDGEYADVLAGIEAMTPEMLAGTPIEEEYRAIAPSPDSFPELVRKLKSFLTTEFEFSEEELLKISVPVMVLSGDSDTVRPEHSVELFRLLGGGVAGDLYGLPNSQLAILPGTTHASIVSTGTDRLTDMIVDFLDADDERSG